jgi:Ser/Thr protein kinase RdoA (MazF antagonist)
MLNRAINDPASSGNHPFEALTPDLVMDALASVGLCADGRLMALNSFENRVYLAHLESDHQYADPSDPTDPTAPDAVVLKFYRPERWSAAELMADDIPVIGPLRLNGETLHGWQGFRFSVSPRRGGRRPELDDVDVLEWTGRFLARIHTVGARAAFQHRPALNTSTFGQDSAQWLLAHNIIPIDVQSAWQMACDDAIKLINESGVDTAKTLRLHGDCHPGNILWTPAGQPQSGPHFVDLDDARTGPAVQDLWMLLSGERREQTQALSALLDGYEQVRAFDRSELALIEPLRTLRLIHYSAWLARRWQDPIFPINFPWFGSRDYWQGQVHLLVDQIEAMQAAPLSV